MNNINNSVVHLTMRFQETTLSIGTGVLYQNENDFYIVTAWHNLSGLHSESLTPLSKKSAIPDNVVVNLAINIQNLGATRISFTIPLQDENKSLFYISKDNWPRIDVAVIPFNPNSEFRSEIHLSTGEQRNIKISPIMKVEGGNKVELCPIQKYFLPNPYLISEWFNCVDVSEELFIPGYPHNVQDYYAQPVWKRATIASSVQDGWNREPKFLVDSASKSGMSGAPVLYYSPNGTIKIKNSVHQFSQNITILAGIYVGRIGIEGESDPQIGTVWHHTVIEKIISEKCFERLPNEIEISNQELKNIILKKISTYSKQDVVNIADRTKPAADIIKNLVMKEINGRSSPSRVKDEIFELALNQLNN